MTLVYRARIATLALDLRGGKTLSSASRSHRTTRSQGTIEFAMTCGDAANCHEKGTLGRT